jgi:tetratricopeptide (TPR) repeat protein
MDDRITVRVPAVRFRAHAMLQFAMILCGISLLLPFQIGCGTHDSPPGPPPPPPPVVPNYAKDQQDLDAAVAKLHGGADLGALALASRKAGNNLREWGGFLAAHKRSQEAALKYELCEKAYLESEAIEKKLGRTFNMAKVRYNMGMLYRDWGRRDQALKSIAACVALFQRASESDFRADQADRSVLLNMAANIYNELGAPANAIQTKNLALRTIKDPELEIVIGIDIVKLCRATADSDPKHLERFRTSIRNVLNAAARHSAAPETYVAAVSDLMQELFVSGRYDEALMCAPTLLEGWQRLGEEGRSGVAGTYLEMATSYLNLMRREDALHSVDAALTFFAPGTHDMERAHCYLVRGLINYAMGDKESLKDDIERAAQTLRSTRIEAGSKKEMEDQLTSLTAAAKVLGSANLPDKSPLQFGLDPSKPMDQLAWTIVTAEGFIEQKQYREGLGTLKSKEALFRDLGSAQFLTLFYRLQGECYFGLEPVE